MLRSRTAAMSAFLLLLLLLVALPRHFCPSNAERQDLSDIRYHFTPCGATGRTGPSVLQCYANYGEESLLGGGDRLFEFEGNRYPGAQGFRVPRSTLYNVTIAGASGGRGVCNILTGKGLIMRFRVELSDGHELLISVGQKGISPCDTGSNQNLMLCQSPPVTFDDTYDCDSAWVEYLTENFNVLRSTVGGAGGGGASVIFARTAGGNFSRPLSIAGGGGGSSAELRLVEFCFFSENGTTQCTQQFVQSFMNASRVVTENPTVDGTQGIRGFVSAGAGGGLSLATSITTVDGASLSLESQVEFAVGGFECTRILGGEVPFLNVFGGFGGGGGGCGGGGGGGGFHGGDVFGFQYYEPGGGGTSAVFNTSIESVESNDGDGFVDIVPADCNCAYQCVVYKETDEFRCLCPDSTFLAPDQFDCFKTTPKVVSKSLTQAATTTQAGFTIAVYSLGTTVLMYSMEATLNSISANSNDEQSCAIVYFSDETDDKSNVLLLTSNAIRDDGGVVSNVSRVRTKGLEYIASLESPFRVSGAILLSTGECVIEDMRINMNISIQSNSSLNEDLGLKPRQFANILRTLNDSDVSRTLLQLGPPPTTPTLFTPILSTPATSPFPIGRIVGSVVPSILLLVAIISIVALLIVFCVYHRKKRNAKPSDSVESQVELTASTYVSFSAAFQNQVAQTDKESAKHAYETLGFGNEENDGYSKLTFSTRFGVTAPEHDFSPYNRERANTVISEWNYPRSKLIYMREIGEGQFGKVLLMKAQGIAGYTGKIPVAVKTLTSRDLEVVRKFMEEADLMKTFSHPNIVSLLGICSREVGDEDEDSAPLMILEYMQHGDMQAFLQSHRLGINEVLLHRFARDIASAMEFLAQRKYVHRDLAARNCLVGPSLQVKIADFGLARGVHDKDYYRVAGQAVLPVRWMAPECLLYGVFTTASDVWAYGVVLWEMMTYGEMPFDELEVQEIIKKAQNESLRHSKPENAPEDLYDAMCLCHKHEAKQRPSFTEILAMLTKEEEEEQEEEEEEEERAHCLLRTIDEETLYRIT